MGAETLTTPCPSCFSAFKKAHVRMAKNKAFKEEVNELLDSPYEGTVKAKSTLQIIYEDIGLEEVAAKVTQALPDLKVAPYYGCIINRPPKIAQFDDPENPVSMDQLIEAVGVEVVDYAFKMECCGAAFGVPKKEMVHQADPQGPFHGPGCRGQLHRRRLPPLPAEPGSQAGPDQRAHGLLFQYADPVLLPDHGACLRSHARGTGP